MKLATFDDEGHYSLRCDAITWSAGPSTWQWCGIVVRGGRLETWTDAIKRNDHIVHAHWSQGARMDVWLLWKKKRWIFSPICLIPWTCPAEFPWRSIERRNSTLDALDSSTDPGPGLSINLDKTCGNLYTRTRERCRRASDYSDIYVLILLADEVLTIADASNKKKLRRLATGTRNRHRGAIRDFLIMKVSRHDRRIVNISALNALRTRVHLRFLPKHA